MCDAIMEPETRSKMLCRTRTPKVPLKEINRDDGHNSCFL